MKNYPLSHIVRDGTITMYADGVVLNSAAWALADDGRSVKLAAPAGAELSADYSWISESPVVRQFVSVFGE